MNDRIAQLAKVMQYIFTREGTYKGPILNFAHGPEFSRPALTTLTMPIASHQPLTVPSQSAICFWRLWRPT